MHSEVNFISPINQLGYGIAGLNIVKFSEIAGRQVALHVIGNGPDMKDYDAPYLGPAIERGRFFNPKLPSVRMYHQFDLALHCGSKRIGYPIFELDTFTKLEKHHLNSQDELFVCSSWAKTIVEQNGITTPTKVSPLGVDRSIFHENWPNARTNNTTVFFNVGKWEMRKGHDVIIDAFEKAFSPTDDVRLVMCCVNPFLEPYMVEAWVSRYKNGTMGGKVDIVTTRFSNQYQLAQFMTPCDVGVFPARAEGWNLDLLEAMSCGKHVITTNATAHTEFVNSENASLIGVSELEPAFDYKFFNGQGNWYSLGDTQVDEMVAYMRDYHKRKQEKSLGVNVKGIETAERFSWKNSVSKFWSNLDGQDIS